MENEVKDIEQLKQELEKTGHKVEDVNFLFLDLSSTCTGYSLVRVNFKHRSAEFLNSGVIWFDDSMTNQDKYHYIFNAVTNYFNIVGQIDFCVAEAYMINRNKMMGAQVGPELHGALQVSLAEIGVKYSTVLPQTWRSQLGIKPNVSINSKGKKERDFKTPTKAFVDSKAKNIPAQIKSNVTGNLRQTPSDLYDAVAISCGFLNKLGISTWNFSKLKIQESIQL